MPYTIGGVNIRDLAELGATNDPREATGFTTSKYLYQGYSHQDWYGTRMFINYSGYIYSNEMGIQTRYLRNSSTYFSVAAKGCRPCPTYSRRRWDSSTAATYYVNKFSDGEVWVSTTFNSRSGTRISTTAENIRYIFVMLIGPGGGGGGGNGTKAGGGGGGGAFAYLCHNLVAGRVHRIYIGAGGGAGARNTNGGGSGNCQFSTFNDINNLGTSGVTTVNATGGGGGGSGGNDGYGGGGGTASSYDSNGGTHIHRLDERTGASGGARGNGGGSTAAYSTQAYSAEGHRLDYGQGAGGAVNGSGGGGGGWFYGHNGGSSPGASNGGSGGIGAGGGGGDWALFAGYAGGNGGNGYAAIFY